MTIQSKTLNLFWIDTLGPPPLAADEKICPHQSEDLKKIARVWACIADQKSKQTDVDSEKASFLDCAAMCKSIVNTLDDVGEYEAKIRAFFDRGIPLSVQGLDIYACKDEKDQLQALAIVAIHNNSLLLRFLSTNPINISSAVNLNEVTKVRGAGSLLMKSIESRACALQKSTVAVHALESARGFYQKHGYSLISGSLMEKEISRDEIC